MEDMNMPTENYVRCEKCKKYFSDKNIVFSNFKRKSDLPFNEKVIDKDLAACRQCTDNVLSGKLRI